MYLLKTIIFNARTTKDIQFIQKRSLIHSRQQIIDHSITIILEKVFFRSQGQTQNHDPFAYLKLFNVEIKGKERERKGRD